MLEPHKITKKNIFLSNKIDNAKLTLSKIHSLDEINKIKNKIFFSNNSFALFRVAENGFNYAMYSPFSVDNEKRVLKDTKKLNENIIYYLNVDEFEISSIDEEKYLKYITRLINEVKTINEKVIIGIEYSERIDMIKTLEILATIYNLPIFLFNFPKKYHQLIEYLNITNIFINDNK